MKLVETFLRRADRTQQRHAWLAFPYAVLKKFGDDGAGNLAALIAYFAFFSIFPLLLLLVTIVGFVLGARNGVASAVLASFPIVGPSVRDHSLRGSGVALAIGIVAALWAGLGVIRAMQTAMNRIWDVPPRQQPGFLQGLRRSVAMVFVFGATTLTTGALSALAAADSTGALTRLGVIVAQLAVNLFLYVLAFRVLTERDVSPVDVLPGAVVGAVLWTILQSLGGYYVNHQIRGASQTYGTFAVVIGLLSWLYLGAQFSLFAAEINVVRSERLWPRSVAPPPAGTTDRQSVPVPSPDSRERGSRRSGLFRRKA